MKEATTMQVYIEEKEDQEEAVDGSKHEGHLSHINDWEEEDFMIGLKRHFCVSLSLSLSEWMFERKKFEEGQIKERYDLWGSMTISLWIEIG